MKEKEDLNDFTTGGKISEKMWNEGDEKDINRHWSSGMHTKL